MKLTGKIVFALFILPLLIGVVVPIDEVRTCCAILLVFISLPVAIIWCVDRFRNDEGGTFFRGFMRVALIGLGVVCVLVALGVIGWLLWNLVVKREKSFEMGSLGFILAMLVFGVGMVKLGFSPRFGRKDALDPGTPPVLADRPSGN